MEAAGKSFELMRRGKILDSEAEQKLFKMAEEGDDNLRSRFINDYTSHQNWDEIFRLAKRGWLQGLDALGIKLNEPTEVSVRRKDVIDELCGISSSKNHAISCLRKRVLRWYAEDLEELTDFSVEPYNWPEAREAVVRYHANQEDHQKVMELSLLGKNCFKKSIPEQLQMVLTAVDRGIKFDDLHPYIPFEILLVEMMHLSLQTSLG